MKAGLFDFSKEHKVGVGYVEWIVWNNEQSLTEDRLKKLIKNQTPIKVKWPSIDERKKKSTEKVSVTVDAILLSTGSWEDMSTARENIDKYGKINPTKEDRKTVCQVAQKKTTKIHGNSRLAKEQQAKLHGEKKVGDSLTEKEKEQAKNVTQVKKLYKAESQRNIIQKLTKKKEFLDDILDSDHDFDTLDNLKQRNRALVIENRRLREVISGIDGYARILSEASQLENLLFRASKFITQILIPEQSSTTIFENLKKKLPQEADVFFKTNENEKSTPSATLQKIAEEGLANKSWADPLEPIIPDDDHENRIISNDSESNVQLSKTISESIEASHNENINITVDKLQGNPFSVDPMKLKSCRKTKVSVYIPELLAVLFTEEELSTSSLTGKISNLHKNRKTGIREKKMLDPEKVQFFYKCVTEHFPDVPKKTITEKLKAKLRYEAQKTFGVGFKTEKKPSKKSAQEKESKQ